MRKTITGLALVTMAMVGASTAEAQARFASSTNNVAKAAALEAQAVALYDTPRRFSDAARLLERAADLRPAGDAQQIENLRQAARLYHYAGNASRARGAMVRAAEIAVASGHVAAAATTYLDAAFLYHKAGMNEQVVELVRKAELLTHSPALSAQERQAILSRLNAA